MTVRRIERTTTDANRTIDTSGPLQQRGLELLHRFAGAWDHDGLAWSPDGQRLATGGRLSIWSKTSGTWSTSPLRAATHSAAKVLAWHPKGRLLAAGHQDLTIRLWNPDLTE